MAPRISSGWIAGLVVLALLLPFVALTYAIPVISERRWAETMSAARARMTALNSRVMKRPVLRGEPEAGNAWTEYRKGETQPKNWQDFNVVQQYLDRGGEVRRETAQACLEQFLPMLEPIRRGARREDISQNIDWSTGSWPGFNGWRLSTLAICRARFLAEEDRSGEAVDLLLDVMQYCIDASQSSTWYAGLTAITAYQKCLYELQVLLRVGLLDLERVRTISRALTAFDAQFPRCGEGFLNEAMQRTFRVSALGSVDAVLQEYSIKNNKITSWRYGCMERLLLAKFVELQQRSAERVAAGDGASWSEARKCQAEACVLLTTTSNPLVQLICDPTSKVDYTPFLRTFREILAQTRLLRMALHHQAEGILLALDDPFGDRLQSSRRGRVLKLWSVGGDGVDDGGSGDWSTKGSRDIVLELRR